jgi:putative endopeptidase
MKDFYSFINQDWLNQIQLNTDQVRTNSFECIARHVKKQLYTILDDQIVKQTLLGKIFAKVHHRDANISYFVKYYNMIDAVNNIDDFTRTYGTFATYGTTVFFDLFVTRDIKHPDKFMFAFDQDTCTLPEQSYYDKYETEYKHFLREYSMACGFSDVGIFDLENMLRKITMKPVERRNLDKRYNMMSMDKFKQLWPFDIELMINEYKKLHNLQPVEICVDNIEYIVKLIDIVGSIDIEVIKNYLKYKFTLLLPQLCKPDNIIQIEFNFFKGTLLSIPIDRLPKSKALMYIMNYMPDALGVVYLEKHMTEQAENYVIEMNQLIKSSTKDVIYQCSWLSTETKQKIIEKIDAIGIKVGGTKIPRTYERYTEYIDQNIVDMTVGFEIQESIDNFEKLGTMVNKQKWSMASYSVNAYYSPLNNEMVIPCAILNDPFFSTSKTIYDNLGGIGSVIAHEISHGFDDQGRQFDKNGYHRVWWLDKDIDEYKKRVNKIREQYGSVVILGQKVSGDITIGENIADYTGVLTLTNILKKNNATKCNYARLYGAYAKIWRQKIRDKEMIRRIKTDPHAPPRLRTNIILSNIPEFAMSFDLKSNHPMYIARENQFNLWN